MPHEVETERCKGPPGLKIVSVVPWCLDHIMQVMWGCGKGLWVVGCGKQEDEEAEYEAWKDREMARIARDREEKRREAAEAEERERLKHMTDEERRQWERDHPKARTMISFKHVCAGLIITSAHLLNTGQLTGMLLRLDTRKPSIKLAAASTMLARSLLPVFRNT